MAFSLSTKISRSLLSIIKPSSFLSGRLFCSIPIDNEDVSHFDTATFEPDTDNNNNNNNNNNSSRWNSNQQEPITQKPLQDGLDYGVYRAILVGRVGQCPVQKKLRSGKVVTLFSLGTGGMRNNRRPLENEEPKEYAERCAVQWHRVSVYPERLGALALKHVKPGTLLYLEGNLETKVFTNQQNGLVRRIREVAVRRDGRLLFLGNDGGDEGKPTSLAGVGYY